MVRFLKLFQHQNYKFFFVVNDLTFRTQELLNIRQSVLKELRQLERNRSTVIQQLNEMNNEMEKLKTQLNRKSTELERLQLHIKQAAIAQKEAKDRVDSLIEPPLNLLPKQAQQNSPIEGKWTLFLKKMTILFQYL